MKQKEELVPREQIPEATRILTNVAYLMGDVTSTLMLNAETRVERLGFGMKHGLKQRLKYALEATTVRVAHGIALHRSFTALSVPMMLASVATTMPISCCS